MRAGKKLLAIIVLTSFFGAAACLAADARSPVDVWQTLLKPRYFPDTEIVEGDSVIELKTPYRSEDAAFTPVTVKARFAQTPERYIQKIYLIADGNPEPLAGTFEMTPDMGRADLALRIRIDNYTNVRAIAVLNTGEHHMAVNFVKAQGGCSAPLGSDFNKAMERIGTMNFRTVGKRNEDDTVVGQLMLSHPNVTGMQKDQKTQLIRPAHYVKEIRLFFNERLIMTAHTGISISEDPSFRFFFRPDQAGEFRAEVVDSKGMTWRHAFKVDA